MASPVPLVRLSLLLEAPMESGVWVLVGSVPPVPLCPYSITVNLAPVFLYILRIQGDRGLRDMKLLVTKGICTMSNSHVVTALRLQS